MAPHFELDATGFEMAEVDILLDGNGADEEDELRVTTAKLAPVTRVGDLWNLGDHRLLCANALQADSYLRVSEGEKVDMMFADPPYNLPIKGHVSGLGANSIPTLSRGQASSRQQSSSPS